MQIDFGTSIDSSAPSRAAEPRSFIKGIQRNGHRAARDLILRSVLKSFSRCNPAVDFFHPFKDLQSLSWRDESSQ